MNTNGKCSYIMATFSFRICEKCKNMLELKCNLQIAVKYKEAKAMEFNEARTILREGEISLLEKTIKEKFGETRSKIEFIPVFSGLLSIISSQMPLMVRVNEHMAMTKISERIKVLYCQ